MKLDLLTNATVVDDAIRFVSSQKFKEKVEPSSNNGDDTQQSNESDYNEDKLEEKQEKNAEDIITTTNQVF